MTDEDFMRRAIELSAIALTENTGGPFGAVVVKDGAIIGEGANEVGLTNDPTAHAEVVAIRRACERLGTYSLEGCTIYASCEPCPMCLGAILWARIDAVVFAADRHDAAGIGFDDAKLHETLEDGNAAMPRSRLLREEARAVFARWVERTDRLRY